MSQTEESQIEGSKTLGSQIEVVQPEEVGPSKARPDEPTARIRSRSIFDSRISSAAACANADATSRSSFARSRPACSSAPGQGPPTAARIRR